MREGRGQDERLLRGKGSHERRCDSRTQACDRLGRGMRCQQILRSKGRGRDRGKGLHSLYAAFLK